MSHSDGGVTEVPARSGLRPAVLTRLAAMTGAGLFVVFAPAAVSAGNQLVLAVLLAAVVAAASAHSAFRLVAADARAQGRHGLGLTRLGLPWANLSGWAFLLGATAAAAVMAMAIGVHLRPDDAKIVAVLTVLTALALHLQGVRRSSRVPRVIVRMTLVIVLVFAVVLLIAPPVTVEATPPAAPGSGDVRGILQGAGFLLFVFIGFGQVSNFGEDVAQAPRTTGRAIAIALGVATALHLLVAVALTRTLGAGWVAARQAPLAEAAELSAWPWLGVGLRIAVVLAAGGVLLALLIGAAGTIVALARDHHLPAFLTVVDGQHGVPRRAAAIVGGVVVIVVVLVDLPGAIALSSFLFLVYHAIANASAWTLDRRPVARLVPALGLLGCILLAAMLPWPTIVIGVAVLLLGAVTGWVRHATSEGRPA